MTAVVPAPASLHTGASAAFHGAGEDVATRPLTKLQRLVLWVLPTFMALGPWASPTPGAEGGVTAFRVLLVLTAIPALASVTQNWRSMPTAVRRAIWATVTLLVWGLVSLTWSADMAFGLRIEVSLLIGLTGVLVMLGFSQGTDEGVGALRWGYLLALLVTGGIALWEFRTGQHLSDVTAEQGPYVFSKTAVSASLGNPNNFGAFLLSTLGPLLVLMSRSKHLLKLGLTLTMLGLLSFLTVQTESRAAVGGLLAMLVIAMLLLAFINLGYLLMGLMAGAMAYFTVITFLGPQVQGVLDRLTDTGQDKADQLRLDLTHDAIQQFSATGGLGTGMGAFQAVLENTPDRLARTIVPAHNTLAQVAAENGVVGLAAFLGVLVACISVVFTRGGGAVALSNRFEIVLVIIAVGVSMIVASYMLNHAELWVNIGYMLCLVWNVHRHRDNTGSRLAERTTA
ncbi:O-antigen ligase [Kytococcus sp. HMSC28H12]|uniref:O-antigen ligase family protein n=1 Tax=Kytococcus sp. HMSC28H12 TaxID=1581067 RepID=UPI0008A55CAA|nr:O-antigen ligase family protein [Kytococcus sp. HMSC28H12]OFS15013.1 hypothetical protein HMPREF3099_02920 [Kytococcus sp. HMSC28H12]